MGIRPAISPVILSIVMPGIMHNEDPSALDFLTVKLIIPWSYLLDHTHLGTM